MKLKKIKAFGFKTFAEPVTLEFGDGITAIVGPNGSGKSNFVDAVRWVLGETSSKSLRSGKTEDVIFAGNEKRKPLGLADVSIVFDNQDGRLPVAFAEVEITRRAYRSGESEYFINRSQVRLRDVLDLLMGTGLGPGSYAIVSQGQIDAILASKPADRRALFEETAGIGKFLARKHESLRRLEQTEANAIRISDLIAELERRVPELDAQVRRAKRYRKVGARVRDLELLSYIRASAARRTERDLLREQAEREEAMRTAAAARLASAQARMAELRNRQYRAELEVEELRAQAQAIRADLARHEAEFTGLQARRETLEAQSTRTDRDAERVAAERERLQAAIADLDARIAPLREDLDHAKDEELHAQRALAQSRAGLDALFTRLREYETRAAASAAERAERRAQGERLRAEAERLEAEAHALHERLRDLDLAEGAARARENDHRRTLRELETRLEDGKRRLAAVQGDLTAAQEEVERSERAVRDANSALEAARARLHTIEELENALEGHGPGTRAVIEAHRRGELGGIEGIVSNLITVEERYARALDTAFGLRLSNVVVRTAEDAERAIAYLDRHEAGRATFLPLDTLADRDGKTLSQDLAREAGVIGYAHTLVQTDPAYESIVRFLVGSVLVVDTLQTGIRLVRTLGVRDTIVTLAGEQIAGGGAITGGRFKRDRSILSRRARARALQAEVEELTHRLAALEADLARARERAGGIAREREELGAVQARLEVEAAELRLQAQRAADEAARAHAEALDARARLEGVEVQAREAREKEAELLAQADDAAVDAGERAQLEAALAHARDEIARAEAAQAAVAERVAQIRERYSALSAERDAAGARLAMLDQDDERARLARERMLAEIGDLLEQTRVVHARVEGLRRGAAEADARLDAARRERERLQDEVTRAEAELHAAQQEEREASAAGERVRTRLAELEAELGMLVAQFAQNPASDAELRDVEERYREADDAILEELPRLRDELSRLAANVNLNAEAEREELAERERFLREQLDDLSRARETLLASIKEIEQQTQQQFNETFERVAEEFARTYAELFPGGWARMWQTDPENLSETGIEIDVQPPGKKKMALTALSGGERAMVAASLIFALVKVKPSPFYLLDEIDAALDDSNVENLASAIRDLSSRSQMIVVTHNKKTMELADRLYGITMREPGVSTVVSVALAEREPEPALV